MARVSRATVGVRFKVCAERAVPGIELRDRLLLQKLAVVATGPLSLLTELDPVQEALDAVLQSPRAVAESLNQPDNTEDHDPYRTALQTAVTVHDSNLIWRISHHPVNEFQHGLSDDAYKAVMRDTEFTRRSHTWANTPGDLYTYQQMQYGLLGALTHHIVSQSTRTL